MKLVKTFALILLITILVVSFQSCTIKQGTGLLGSKTSEQSKADAVLENAPFAYDYAADTISYNSCSGDSFTTDETPGFKIGSNGGFSDSVASGAVQGGVKLRTEFLDYVGKNIQPNSSANLIQPAQIQSVLKNSPKNLDSFIQYAIRTRSDLKVLVDTINPTATTAAVLKRDGVIENTSLLNDSALAEITKSIVYSSSGTVLSEGQRVYNLQPKSAIGAPMEGALLYNASVDSTFPAKPGSDDGFGAGEQYADIVRRKFNSGGIDKVILAVTYGNPNAATSANGNDAGLNNPKRPISGDLTKAYGRGYELKFESVSAKAGWLQNRLTKVTESALGGETLSVGTWTCQNFVIMKKSHWNNPKSSEAGCAALTSADLQDPVFSAQVKLLRRHYSDANWRIGIYYGANEAYTPSTRPTRTLCLAPTSIECYLPTAGLTADGSDIGVQYNPSQECYLSRFERMSVAYTGGLTGDSARKLGRCAQYASICSRQ